jgi:serine/threonine protein kinase
LGGSDHSAVFLTERGEPDPQKAAIKLIPVNAADPELQLSWWELAARLSHPHLLRLGQRGRCQIDDAEMLYAVSEYAEENLAQILPHRPLSPAETLDVLQAVLDALGYIHGKGFVHGHIKPSNIMAVADQVKVSGDGFCGTGESSRVLGPAGIYTAPEIASGGGMSPSSDVWSLGMTLVEAMTQHPPVLEGMDRSDPVVPETLPDPFREIASNCLRRNPRQRWTIPQIAARVQGVTPEPRVVEAVASPTAPNNSRYIVAAGAGLLLLAIVAGPKIFRSHQDPEPAIATTAEPQNAPAATVTASAPPSSTSKSGKKANGVPAASRKAGNAVSPVSTGSASQGAVAAQVIPDVPRSAGNTIHGIIKISIRADVDETGNVTSTKFASHGSSKYFSKLAMDAADHWTFNPPQVAGRAVASEWLVKFEFSRSGTKANAQQTSP